MRPDLALLPVRLFFLLRRLPGLSRRSVSAVVLGRAEWLRMPSAIGWVDRPPLTQMWTLSGVKLALKSPTIREALPVFVLVGGVDLKMLSAFSVLMSSAAYFVSWLPRLICPALHTVMGAH